MKHYLILFFCIVAIFSFVACSEDGDQVQAERPAAESSLDQFDSDLANRVTDSPEPKPSKEPAEMLEQKPSAAPVEVPEQESNPSGETGLVGNPSEPLKPKDGNEMKLNVQIGSSSFTAIPEANASTDAFVELMKNAPLVINMSDYSGFEKIGDLGTSLPTSNNQITTQSGDIVLYNGNQIVIFYGSNTWSYTRLAKINDLTGWESALGSGDVTVTFTLD